MPDCILESLTDYIGYDTTADIPTTLHCREYRRLLRAPAAFAVSLIAGLAVYIGTWRALAAE